MIVGLESPDDAGVYQLTDDLAIIQTVDYFTPIVDDPYNFGQIAAANALSDVYAMGGKPVTAMNLVCFPIKTMDISILREILRGGLEKMKEAGVILVGGHSVEDPELKYGLSVTGLIHPGKVVLSSDAKPGDSLILTKPIGTGIINTAIKAGMADATSIAAVTEQMATLNRKASDLMQKTGIHACTDVTGFGLLGHACEMIQNSSVGMEIFYSKVPVFAQAPELSQIGLIPAGTYRNRDFRANMVEFDPDVPEYMHDILFDAQTSGGLLIAVSPEKAEILLSRMHAEGIKEAAIIGRVTEEHPGEIIIEGTDHG